MSTLTIPRRGFLRTMSLGSSLIGAGGLLDACARRATLAPRATPATQPTPARTTNWDMSWIKRVNRPHRVVFDVTKIADGDALWQTTSWMQGYAEAEGAADADLNAVLVFRHGAVTPRESDAGGCSPGITG